MAKPASHDPSAIIAQDPVVAESEPVLPDSDPDIDEPSPFVVSREGSWLYVWSMMPKHYN